MLETYTAVVKQDEDAWIGWIEEVPGVNCQEPTREALLASVRVTLAEAEWDSIAEKREQELCSGAVEAVPVDVAIARLEAGLRRAQ